MNGRLGASGMAAREFAGRETATAAAAASGIDAPPVPS